MTQAQFNKEYKIVVPNYKKMTLTDRKLHYNDLMESFSRNGQITERQRSTWGHPAFLTTHEEEIDCNAY